MNGRFGEERTAGRGKKPYGFLHSGFYGFYGFIGRGATGERAYGNGDAIGDEGTEGGGELV